jgi:hypothetical protein
MRATAPCGRFRQLYRLLFTLAVGATLLQGASGSTRVQGRATFAAQIAALSESDGYFDTDNLISNERSYLQVLPELQRLRVRGGAYIGVGPDQNFSYIAAVRPAIAYIIDIRRDNLLLHLLFKSLFAHSRTRIEYLALLFGRAVPGDLEQWRHAGIERLVNYIDEAGTPDSARVRIDDGVSQIGVPLSREDLATIERFHRRFIDAGLGLRFQSKGRPPQSYYPTYRELLLETDSLGQRRNYLASEEAFQFVKSLQARDRVIPVVGDLSGPSSFSAIGRVLSEQGEHVSAVYASNVEFYLFGRGAFPRFVANLGRLPRNDRSVIIRSVFGRYALLDTRARDASISRVQLLKELLEGFAAGRFQRYDELAAPGQ